MHMAPPLVSVMPVGVATALVWIGAGCYDEPERGWAAGVVPRMGKCYTFGP